MGEMIQIKVKYGFFSALLLGASIPVEAGIVYGAVSGGHPGDMVIVYKNNRELVRVDVDSDGKYRVFLDPGKYQITVKKTDGHTLKRVIQSFEGVSRQDIR